MNHFKLIPLEERIVFDGAAAAHIFYVNANAHSGGNGLSWGSAFNDLQTAINTADHLSGSTQIWVAKGTYVPDAVPGTFLIADSNPLAIYGGFNVGATNLSQRNPTANPTILNGGGTVNTIVTINGGTITLDGLTITGANNPSGPGGGVLEQNNATLTVSHDTFTNDLVGSLPGDYGGGIASFNSSLTVSNSTFTGNAARDGAAIAAVGDSTLTINSSVIKNNQALFSLLTDPNDYTGGGGAVFAINGNNVNISSNTINNNVSGSPNDSSLTEIGGAGGIQVQSDVNVTINSNTIENNLGGEGGILAVSDTNLSFTNNNLSSNNGLGNGGNGGGYIISCDSAIFNSNIIDNNTGAPNIMINSGTGGVAFTGNNQIIMNSNIIDNNNGAIAGIASFFNTGNESFTNNIFSGNVGHGFEAASGLFSAFDVHILVSGNLFSNNSALDPVFHLSDGGALAVGFDETAIITNNKFTNNLADYGGAIFTTSNTSLTITNNLFQGNIANFAGGAISSGLNTGIPITVAPDISVNISQNIFIGNQAGTLGGAVATNGDTSLTLDQNVFIFNTAAYGGAINDTSSGSLSITNDVFAGNLATALGNSLWLDGGQTTINGLTVSLTPQTALIDQLVDDNVNLLSDDILIA